MSEDLNYIEDILTNCISDFSNNLFDELLNICEMTRPRVIKRKIVVIGKKRKYQTLIKVNRLHDFFIDEMSFNLRMIKKLIKER